MLTCELDTLCQRGVLDACGTDNNATADTYAQQGEDKITGVVVDAQFIAQQACLAHVSYTPCSTKLRCANMQHWVCCWDALLVYSL